MTVLCIAPRRRRCRSGCSGLGLSGPKRQTGPGPSMKMCTPAHLRAYGEGEEWDGGGNKGKGAKVLEGGRREGEDIGAVAVAAGEGESARAKRRRERKRVGGWAGTKEGGRGEGGGEGGRGGGGEGGRDLGGRGGEGYSENLRISNEGVLWHRILSTLSAPLCMPSPSPFQSSKIRRADKYGALREVSKPKAVKDLDSEQVVAYS